MNLVLFSAAGFAFLFSLIHIEKEETLKKILTQTLQIGLGISVLAGCGMVGYRFNLRKEEISLAAFILAYLVCVSSKRPWIYFITVCGLGFPLLAHVPAAETLLGVLQTVTLFAGFRILMLGLRARVLFFRAPVPFFGMPLFLVQAFWASLILAVFIVFFPLPQ